MYKKYLLTAVNSLMTEIVYNTNFILKIVMLFFQTSVSIMMWIGIEKNSTALGGDDLKFLIFYLLITNISTLIFTSTPIFRISGQIRSGKLTTNLLRPINLIWQSFFTEIGRTSLYLVLYIVLIISSLFFNSFSAFVVVKLSLLIAINLLMFHQLTFFLGTLGFWLIQMWPLRSIFNAVYLLLGGLYFPLSYFPKSIFEIIKYNPFSLVADSVARLVLSHMSDIDFWQTILASVFWFVVFRLLTVVSLSKGIKKYEGVGY